MANSEISENGGHRLSEVFDTVWNVWEYVHSTNEATVSSEFQARLKVGVSAAETAIHMINQLHLFTDNEELEEVSTNEIKYMLLPALLGFLQLKLTQQDRLTIVKKSRLLYTDYLVMCMNYGVTDIEIPKLPELEDESESKLEQAVLPLNPRPDLMALNAKRQNKIERFRRLKETECRLKDLKVLVDREHVDDEVKREYYTTLLRRWVDTSLEELQAISDEIDILEHMAKMRGSSAPSPQPNPSRQSNFRPFILTKSAVQKKVFGAGYPSLPTYTVEEYFDQQVELGNFPNPETYTLGPGYAGGPGTAEDREADDIEKERKEEAGDSETIRKARDWDDWKDDHRRGWGNTQNKG